MIKEWATVVAWHNGIATVHMGAKTACNGCSAYHACGGYTLNNLGSKDTHAVTIVSSMPLKPGQRIELGTKENSLIGATLLVYVMPLLGLLLLAGLSQSLFHSDMAAVYGALLGGSGGFIIAKSISLKVGNLAAFQPIILRVVFPSDVLRVEKEN
ncbi:SoxR-reducing system protein RseC [Pantoea sp. Nvir]|uniref:SoxR-reducing system protein RseC n=1 Tax=Pantoea sp. Nvir TaxID=2576760 RepID=UPI001359876B|nr:SoxR-reducing system protein RseC [Pantoea sp. Nvir]MXP66534.1 SoxR-reducing system protein RseC [Pantoea sp. Nvir]CAJ0992272.1 Protein RseC [Pantoea sp. Nvir]